jgi:hypothetical protein
MSAAIQRQQRIEARECDGASGGNAVGGIGGQQRKQTVGTALKRT